MAAQMIVFKSSTQFEKIKELGSGAFGTTLHVRTSDKREYAIKEVNLTRLLKRYGSNREFAEKLVELSKTEYAKMAQLHHRNIVHVFGSFEELYQGTDFVKQDNALCYLVMEYCKGGDLDGAIKEARANGTTFEEGQIQQWVEQLFSAVEYLHERRMVHRDIKPKNIFLSSSRCTVKLGDFGLARDIDGVSRSDSTRTPVGTEMYCSPELLTGKAYTTKCDVWSLGITVYEVANLRRPFSSVAAIIMESQPPFCREYSTDLQNLVAKMLVKEPEDRPPVDVLLSEPFLTTLFNFESVKVKSLYGEGPRLLAAVKSGDLHVVEEILTAPSLPLPEGRRSLVQHKNENENGILNLAALYGHLDIVKFLVEKIGIDVESRGYKGRTPLMQASCNGHLEVVRYLAKVKRADIDAVSRDSGSKAIHLAAQWGNVDVVRYLLLKKPGLLEEKSKQCGRTPLLHAAENGNIEVVRFLVEEEGANITAVDDDNGSSAVHLAACFGHLQVVDYLLDQCPSLLELENKHGLTALHWAKNISQKEIAKLLKNTNAINYASTIFLRAHFTSQNALTEKGGRRGS